MGNGCERGGRRGKKMKRVEERKVGKRKEAARAIESRREEVEKILE